MLITFFVLTRIIANPLSNVFQKKLGVHADARFIIFASYLLLTLACLPALIYILPLHLGLSFWANMLTCAMLAVAGNTLIVAALQSADLSVLGPLNAYKSIVGLVLGVWMLGEWPSLAGVVGMLMILAGSFFIMDPQAGQNQQNAFIGFLKNKGIRLRLGALLLSAAEAVFLRKALLLSSPAITFVCWCILGLPMAAAVVIYALRRSLRYQTAEMLRQPGWCLLLAVTTGLMQFSTLYTLGVLQVGYALALFQTSILLSVLFGYHFFQEGHIVRRLLGAAIMIIGAILIVTFGGNLS